MAKGINLSIGSDTRAFMKGVQNGVIEPLEDAEDTLKDLAREGTTSGNKLERTFTEQEKATRDYKAELDDLSTKLKSTGRSSSTFGKTTKQSTEEVSEGTKAMKENTASNVKEVAASFDGSMSSISDGAQGLVAELLEGFGPGGLIAGAVLAGGIGLLSTAMGAAEEATDAEKQKVSELTAQLIEAGNQGKLTGQQIADGMADVIENGTLSGESWASLRKNVVASGASIRGVVQALSGNNDELRRQVALSDERIKQDREAIRAGLSAKGVMNEQAKAAVARLAAEQDVNKQLRDQVQVVKDAGQAYSDTEKAGVAAAQVVADSWDAAGTDIDDAISNIDPAKYTKKGITNFKSYLHAMEKAAGDSAAWVEEVMNDQSLTAEGKKKFLAMGYDQGHQVYAGYAKASEADKGAYNRLAAVQGKSDGQARAKATQDALNSNKPRMKVLTELDNAAFQRMVKRANAEAQAYLAAHPLKATAVAYTKSGKPIY